MFQTQRLIYSEYVFKICFLLGNAIYTRIMKLLGKYDNME